MKISRERLRSEAETTGFRPEVLEKVIQLLNLLEGLRSHPFLKGRLALKGGTALNLFVFEMPRLSVDILHMRCRKIVHHLLAASISFCTSGTRQISPL